MAYDEYLAERVSRCLDDLSVNYLAKKMMGGLCYMVDDKMCIGIIKDKLMARIGEEQQKENQSKKGCLPMDFTGRPMKGYVYVDPEGIDMEEDLEHWVKLAVAFNPFAKSSKKKK
jgi:TfoX/Sxy family transcriptional regulator of competence genes